VRDRNIGAWAMALYIHNTTADEWVEDLFPLSRYDEHYRKEQKTRWQESKILAIGSLDSANIIRLCDILNRRWSREAERRF